MLHKVVTGGVKIRFARSNWNSHVLAKLLRLCNAKKIDNLSARARSGVDSLCDLFRSLTKQLRDAQTALAAKNAVCACRGAGADSTAHRPPPPAQMPSPVQGVEAKAPTHPVTVGEGIASRGAMSSFFAPNYSSVVPKGFAKRRLPMVPPKATLEVSSRRVMSKVPTRQGRQARSSGTIDSESHESRRISTRND